MSLSFSGRIALRRLTTQSHSAAAEIPTFLCPGLLRSLQYPRPYLNRAPKSSRIQRRCNHNHAEATPLQETEALEVADLEAKLPLQCHGCGALTQTTLKDEAGFFSLGRRSVQLYMGIRPKRKRDFSAEDEIVKKALENLEDKSILGDVSFESAPPPEEDLLPKEPPICDRCHALKYHHRGVSIAHPSVAALQATIAESPFKYNHILHVMDAADFPMSYISELGRELDVTPQRSKNRRSKTGRFYSDKKTEVTFVITRSDLLAPTKPQVDSLMPHLTEVLRDALGRSGHDVRLGNVKCVSANRGWWTKDLKEAIYKRGGGNWMVGRVNVGKSQLFEVIFPKGGSAVVSGGLSPIPVPIDDTKYELEEALDLDSLLPPAQKETAFPSMPLVSSLPGTTASPIRVPFGNKKGELIDLPGLSRGDLELHVKPEHRSSLVMRDRIKPEQQVMKGGKNLLLGGFIRIAPVDPNDIIMAYGFTTLHPHLTSEEKAIGIQAQTSELSVENISLPGTGEKIASAGVFPLKWDVTKERSGPLTNPKIGKMKPEDLPYKVLSTDLLIEGVGWVELVCQIGRKVSWLRDQSDGVDYPERTSYPSVEVFTPEGRFVAARRPLNAWVLQEKKKTTKSRPRRSMKGYDKLEKQRKRIKFEMYEPAALDRKTAPKPKNYKARKARDER